MTAPSLLESLLASMEDDAAIVADGETPVTTPVAAPATPAARKRAASKRATAKRTSSSAIADALEALEPGAVIPMPSAEPTSTPAAKAKPAPVLRPSGQLYHPRQLSGRPDVEALRSLRTKGVPVLLSGYPGCGKTALVEAAFFESGGVHTFAGHGEAEIGDLVGTYVQRPDGTFHWEHGPLVKAMLAGMPLFVDDATLTPSGVLARLYPAMDGRGVITLTEHEGEEIVAQPGFYVIAAHNPGVPGAVLSEALASRFSLHLEVPTDLDLAVELGVDRAVVRVAKAMQKKRKEGDVLWAPEMRELLAFSTIKDVLGRKAALENLVSICPEADREVFMPLLTRLLAEVKPLTLEST